MGAAANANSGSGSGTVPRLHVAGKGCLRLWVGAGTLQRDVRGGERAGGCLSALAASLARLSLGLCVKGWVLCRAVGVRSCLSRPVLWGLWTEEL